MRSSSVRLVCLPDRDHSVSPCRSSTSLCFSMLTSPIVPHVRHLSRRACLDDLVTRVLAVANQKGGVAKTTTVASLGAALMELKQRVLLVDLDPQGCLTFSLGHDPDKLPVSIHEVLLGDVEPSAALVETDEGMTLLPANIDLAGAEAMLLMRAGREYALKRALTKVRAEFD